MIQRFRPALSALAASVSTISLCAAVAPAAAEIHTAASPVADDEFSVAVGEEFEVSSASELEAEIGGSTECSEFDPDAVGTQFTCFTQLDAQDIALSSGEDLTTEWDESVEEVTPDEARNLAKVAGSSPLQLPTSGAQTAAAAAAASSFTPVTPPSWCASNTSSMATRTKRCINDFFTGTLNTVVGGGIRVVGTIGVHVNNYIYMYWNTSAIINQTAITMTAKSGSYTPYVSGRFECSGKCTDKEGSLSDRRMTLGTPVVAIGGIAPSMSAGTRENSSTSWVFNIRSTNPTSVSPLVLPSTALKARCDNAYKGASGKGCVVADYKPTISYSRTGSYPAFASHVAKAIASGLEGSTATGALTRTTTTSTISANRSKACPTSLTRPSGYSCDEYPFASTTQGAASGGKARVFSGCKLTTVNGAGAVGFSRCMIPAGQNSGAGSVLGSFYKTNRVHHGDRFYVKIVS